MHIAIMLLMGGGAGAASFKHIHDLAVHYGQPSWIGWANATVVELMSIVSGLEIRRRKRAQPKQPTGFVYLVFFGGADFVSSQCREGASVPVGVDHGRVARAWLSRGRQDCPDPAADRDRSGADDTGPVQPFGRTADVDIQSPAPQAGLDRTAGARGTDPVGETDRSDALGLPARRAILSERSDKSPAAPVETGAVREADRTDNRGLERSIAQSLVPVQRINSQDTSVREVESADHGRPEVQPERHKTPGSPVRDRAAGDVFPPPGSEADYELLELGKTIAVRVAMRRDPLTRQMLINEIRGDGGTISTDRASQLLRWLRADEAAPVGSG